MTNRNLQGAGRTARRGLGPAVGILALGACNAIWGIDDLGYGPPGTAAGIGGQSSSTTSSGGSGAAAASGPCEPLATEPCYDGPEATVEVGECHAGNRTCLASGDGWGPCEGQQLPTTDSCATPTDDDCDGRDCAALWSLQIGSTDADFVHAIAADASGSLFVSGEFSNTVTMGDVSLEAVSQTDGFVARVDGDGLVLWGRAFGGLGWQSIRGIEAAPDGGAVFAGSFSGSIDVGLDTYTSLGQGDLVMGRLDSQGGIVWARHSGSSVAEHARDVGVDAAGAAVIVGNGYSSLDFGGGVRNSGGDSDLFVVKYDAAGAHVWSMLNGNDGAQQATSVAVTPAGVSYVGGSFEGTLDIFTCSLSNAGGTDAFVGRLSAQGQCLWARSFGAAPDEATTAVAVGVDGGPILAGYYAGEIDFGCGPLSFGADGAKDAFVAALSPAGECRWSAGFPAEGDQVPWNLTVDEDGRTFVVGSFAGTVDFGAGPLTSAGDDLFLVVLDADGEHVASKSFPVTTPPSENSSVPSYWPRRSVALGANGGLFVGGIFFGGATVAAGPWSSVGDADGFVALLR